MENNNKELKIKIETLHYGQPRAYADSLYDYKITVDQPYKDNFIKRMCTETLYKCNKESKETREWYESYYTFEKTEKDGAYIYRYTVISPYLD